MQSTSSVCSSSDDDVDETLLVIRLYPELLILPFNLSLSLQLPDLPRPMPQRAGMVMTGAAALGAVSAMLKRFMSCRNTCLERRSLLSIQNQALL